MDPGVWVKPRLSPALTRGSRPDSNSRPAVQISNPLPPRYIPWRLTRTYTYKEKIKTTREGRQQQNIRDIQSRRQIQDSLDQLSKLSDTLNKSNLV